MSPGEEKPAGLNRARLVETALELVEAEGLGALTMRGLADRLYVKAASLYWHVRDRGDLIALLAEELLREVRLPRGGGGPSPHGRGGSWRDDALAVCAALERTLARHRDSARIVLEVPESVERSDAHARLRATLEAGGLPAAVAQEAATMMLVHVLVGSVRGVAAAAPIAGVVKPAAVAIDTGSRGVTLRAGTGMTGLLRVAHDPAAAAPALIRGDIVIVRRRRGVGQGELELNPDHPWRVRVQAPTWNTVLNLAGIDVREIHIDSGAARVEAVLPPPRGVVPIDVSSGVVGVRLRRPPGVKVVAEISTGALQLKLDDFSIGATTSDVRWESSGPSSSDYYRLRINSGSVRVALEQDAALPLDVVRGIAGEGGGLAAALELVLDGVASRGRIG